jgi:hypothetical protein
MNEISQMQSQLKERKKEGRKEGKERNNERKLRICLTSKVLSNTFLKCTCTRQKLLLEEHSIDTCLAGSSQ